MASVAMMVGGALVNALAFSGSNFLFSLFHSSKVAEETKRHDKAVEKLQAAQAAWSQKRIERLDWINEQLKRRNHAVHTFRDVDEAMEEYSIVFGKSPTPLGRKPVLSDFYHPSNDQRDREIVFVIIGMTVTGIIAYKLA